MSLEMRGGVEALTREYGWLLLSLRIYHPAG